MIRALILIFFAALSCLPLARAQDETAQWYTTDIPQTRAGSDDGIDRSTPRSALDGFLSLAAQNQFDKAAQVLNLAEIDSPSRSQAGPEIAQQLAAVIERSIWINWSSIPDRPDAMVESRAGNDPMAGLPRRDIELAALRLDGRDHEIRLARYKPPDGDPVWLFAPQTVAAAPGLYRVYGPKWFESYIPPPMKRELAGLRIWEWIALPVLLGLILLVGGLTMIPVRALAGRVEKPFKKRALLNAALPLALVTASVTAQSLLGVVISFSGPVTEVAAPVLTIIMATGLGLAMARSLDAVTDHITRRYVGEIDDSQNSDARRLYTSIYAVRRVVFLVTIGFCLIFVLLKLRLFDSIGLTFLASAGALTILFGIAGQAVLGNIMASLQVAIAKPVRIGDSIQYEDDWCYVEAIYFTFVQLRTWDERRVIVPVKYFVSKPFENWSLQDARVMRSIHLKLDFMADIDVLRAEFDTIAKNDPGVIEHDQVSTFVSAQDGWSQTVTFYAMSPDPTTAWEMEMRLRESIMSFIRTHHPDWWPRERQIGFAPES